MYRWITFSTAAAMLTGAVFVTFLTLRGGTLITDEMRIGMSACGPAMPCDSGQAVNPIHEQFGYRSALQMRWCLGARSWAEGEVNGLFPLIRWMQDGMYLFCP